MTCFYCNRALPISRDKNRKFCNHSCSAKYNNLNRVTIRAKAIINCKVCTKNTRNKLCCSKKCLGIYNSQKAYDNFIETNGNNHSYYIGPKNFKRYILKEQDYKCAICSLNNYWQSNSLVFILDHIDGNCLNNSRNNLRLVCPNCDSQLDTYKSKNKGSGRTARRIIK